MTVRLVDGNAYGGDAQGDTLFEIENVVGSGYDDTIAGDGFGNSSTAATAMTASPASVAKTSSPAAPATTRIDGGLDDDIA